MPSSRTSLGEYRRKRDFKKTSEPRGRGKSTRPARLVFVVQNHGAKRLHYDLRLQVGDVMKSWAIPRGPSLNPREKRLAMATEDHPLEYARFEGVIPRGEYGAGPMLVWDMGTNRVARKDDAATPSSLDQSLRKGHAVVQFHGRKLKGKYALMLTSKPDQWLLVKVRDEYVDMKRDLIKTPPNSVLSHKSLDEIRSGLVRGSRRHGFSFP